MHNNTDNTSTYLDTSLSFEDRAKDLVSCMTLQEKISQMMHESPAIEHLGVPAYNWWNECLHGVARAGIATVFPQAIGMAASWDVELMYTVATAISDEARAKHHEALRHDDHGYYKGLTFWTPNINIFRDPRWGRGMETYGECPYLTGRMGVAFVKGLQGDDPKYLKLVATPKHYAVHSGPEGKRHTFDADVSRKDLYETYLSAFKDCVVEGKAMSVMGAYNRVYGEACNASKLLLQDILRDEWGFEGYVVSDCGAIQDIHQHHKITECTAESAALSVKNGCDLECGCVYASLTTAVERGLITEAEIDVAVTRLFDIRFKLGMFDPPEMVPYAQIPYEVSDCEVHHQLALKMARESIVLLKNAKTNDMDASSLLPLSKDLKSIAVIGPNADSREVAVGNYFGTPSKWVSALAGIRAAVSADTKVFYSEGCDIIGNTGEWNGGPRQFFTESLSAAQRAEAVIMCLGISARLEGEEGDAFNSDASGDRIRIDLPEIQMELLKAVCALGKPVVLVLFSGSALAINWASENVPAIIEAWYPGAEGGTAIADVIFGNYNPAGRLPVTFYKSLDDVPPFEDYNMTDRTYRYFKGEPLYPFGYGLSYTKFKYSHLSLNKTNLTTGESLELTADITNVGSTTGDEVVQLYLTDLESTVNTPIRKLVAFNRINLLPGETKQIEFTITSDQLSIYNNDGRQVLEPGRFTLTIGGSQGDKRSLNLGAVEALTAEFEVKGNYEL